MAKEVTLKELNDWIKKNEFRTWNWRGGTEFQDRTLELKYIRFSLDTRDMKIFRLDTEGFENASADFRDDKNDWTILDLLESKLKASHE